MILKVNLIHKTLSVEDMGLVDFERKRPTIHTFTLSFLPEESHANIRYIETP